MLFNKLIWYDDYSMQIELLDEQHKQIFSSFNEFFNELNKGNFDREIIDNFIEALDYYTNIHFDTEEKLMLEKKFPNYEEHKKRHEFFKSIYNEIRNDVFIRNSAAHIFALNLGKISGEWWETHIVTYDKELSRFLTKLNTDI